jgi:hypothetical protein
LRDLQADNNELGRTYFPGLNLREFSQQQKRELEKDIEHDLSEAIKGSNFCLRAQGTASISLIITLRSC